ncbi:hypothetical protein D3C71_2046600 [compost metagenome]
MLKKSSLAAISDSGIIWIPSGLPLGELTNRFLKLPIPFESAIALRMASTDSWLTVGSVRYMIKPAWLPFS